MRPLATTISPLDANNDEILSMLVEASFDPDIRVKNYLPSYMDLEQARAFCEASNGVVLRLGEKAVGVAIARPQPDPGEGIEVPPGSAELDMWVLARYRGQGMRWFPLIQEWFSQRFEYVVGVTWSNNDTAIALLRWSGWRWIGRSFWSGGGCEGYCEVFLYDLRKKHSQTREEAAL